MAVQVMRKKTMTKYYDNNRTSGNEKNMSSYDRNTYHVLQDLSLMHTKADYLFCLRTATTIDI